MELECGKELAPMYCREDAILGRSPMIIPHKHSIALHEQTPGYFDALRSVLGPRKYVCTCADDQDLNIGI